MKNNFLKIDAGNALTVCAVIVTFNPDHTRLINLIKRIVDQVHYIVLVDNGSKKPITSNDTQGIPVHYILNSDNYGLATGFNMGIAWAMQVKASHVILLDQDSLPGKDMIKQLLDAERQLLNMNIKLAAVGPSFIDVKSNRKESVIGFENYYTKRKNKPDFDTFIEAAYLISSGELIRSEIFNTIGLMKDGLFIDAIDIDWALRARTKGYRSFVTTSAIMEHDIGEKGVLINSRIKYLHKPERHYYIIRNSLLLLRDKEIPFEWKVTDILKTIRRFIAYPLLCDNPAQHVKWMVRGLKDGLIGKSGRANYPI